MKTINVLVLALMSVAVLLFGIMQATFAHAGENNSDVSISYYRTGGIKDAKVVCGAVKGQCEGMSPHIL